MENVFCMRLADFSGLWEFKNNAHNVHMQLYKTHFHNKIKLFEKKCIAVYENYPNDKCGFIFMLNPGCIFDPKSAKRKCQVINCSQQPQNTKALSTEMINFLAFVWFREKGTEQQTRTGCNYKLLCESTRKRKRLAPKFFKKNKLMVVGIPKNLVKGLDYSILSVLHFHLFLKATSKGREMDTTSLGAGGEVQVNFLDHEHRNKCDLIFLRS